MKKIFNCVFAFFNKDLSTLYKEGSAVNFDAVSSNCFRFFTTSFKDVIGDLFGVSVFILLHARSFTRFQGLSRNEKNLFFFAFPTEILLPRERFIRKCHWEVHFRFSFLTA